MGARWKEERSCMSANGRVASPYNASFYENVIGTSARDSAEKIVPTLLTLARIDSAVDVGCGSGDWLDCLKRHGVSDLAGLEGAWARPTSALGVAITHTDLSQPFRGQRRFDLVLSLEVAEHLPASSASEFVRSLTDLGDLVCFSAAVPFQGGVHHINEQWPEYWAGLFDKFGYRAIDCIRPSVWSDPQVAWWYAQNIIISANDAALATSEVLRRNAAATDSARLSLIHPGCYLSKVEALGALYAKPDPARFSATTYLGLAPSVLVHGLRNRLGRRARREPQ
jgi:hypothetical protein